MTPSVLRHCKTLAIAFLLWTAAARPAVVGPEILDSFYRADIPFPEFSYFWGDSSQAELQLRGETALQQAGREPLGGSLHMFLRNAGRSPLEIQDIFLEGVSLRRGVAFSHRTKYRKYVYAASIHFADLPAHERDLLVSAGEPVWWKVDPEQIPPGGVAEVVVRLRDSPKPETVRLGIQCTDGITELAVPVNAARPRIESISFSLDLQRVYLYLHGTEAGQVPSRILMDGRDITRGASIGADPALGVVPVVCELDAPLPPASLHCFQAVYDDGTTATAALRAWADEIAYGIWGSKPGKESDVELARAYVNEIYHHNINVQMEMVGSAAVNSFLQSEEGLGLVAALGIRRMVNDPGKGNTKEPFAYFLMDEPDAGDYKVEGLQPHQRVGSLAQGLVQRSAELREADAKTPHLLNIDMTFKPDNWYIYGQVPDIFAADPYYQERLRQTYWQQPGRLPMYAKATFIYAVGSISQSACAPKPLHVILNSVRRTKKDRRFRFGTPEEKRIEVYYALAAGAKGLSYWWYTPVAPCYGCGGPEPEAVALWKQIGLLGAEVRTAGPIITRSCPAVVPITASSQLWTRTLLAGLDTMVVLCVNDNYLNDQLGTVYRPVENARLSITLPSWLQPREVFEVTFKGTQDAQWERSGSKLNLQLGTVDLTRLLVVTADAGLRGRLQKLYESKFAGNVARLIGEEGTMNNAREMKVTRFPNNPIIRPDMDGSMGTNINGSSLIRAPEWLGNPLGRYYLYFAHHKGEYIRVAYAERLEGPWKTYESGTLKLEDSFCGHHITSPDVHVDDEKREIRMYYHGPTTGGQKSRVALSKDGIHFTARPEILGAPYFRVFRRSQYHYALGMPGIFYRSKDGLSNFEEGPTLFTEDMRHSALKLDGETLSVFYSNAHDCPERILLSTIDLTPNWMTWKASEPVIVLEPELEYEGADLPLEPSERGWAKERVRQLRDPAVFSEDDKTYLLYSVAGEHGIAIAELKE